MLSAINSTQSFGHRCIVVLPDCTDISKVYEKVRIKNPNFKLTFIEPDALKGRKLAADEFTFVAKEKIKNTPMAKFIFNDGRDYDFQLSAFLKAIYGDARVVSSYK
ncbi:hypothetical protein J6S88_05535 [bacterium]|nr:hypothetical protein [bacterium]